jgi:hypothetical protein
MELECAPPKSAVPREHTALSNTRDWPEGRAPLASRAAWPLHAGLQLVGIPQLDPQGPCSWDSLDSRHERCRRTGSPPDGARITGRIPGQRARACKGADVSR